MQEKVTSKFLQILDNLRYGSLQLSMPDGQKYSFEGRDENHPKASLLIKNTQVISNLSAKGDIGFAESYRDGHFETDNLANLLIIALKNADELEAYMYGNFFTSLVTQIMYFFNNNTLKGSQRNIEAHYDLGNDFYALWLDKTMTYSSAIFNQPNQLLEIAQTNKYNRILNRLMLNQGNVLEIGCGWGGFAEQALKMHDFEITGITLSQQQYQFASNRLNDTVNIKLEDYRHQTGKYDGIVSIEMFEAVGEKYWPVYFNKIKALLKPQGRALIQTIVIGEQHFERYRKTGDMIRSFIFPGGMLPSIEGLNKHIGKADLHIQDIFQFGKSYELTLKRWLSTFEQKLDIIKTMNFDEKFIHIWRFYLSICIASFHVNRTNVVQIELTHAK